MGGGYFCVGQRNRQALRDSAFHRNRSAAGGCGAAAGTGIFPMTCETGTHSVNPSLRHKSVSSTFPEATYFCRSASEYGPYSLKARLMK
jgi:hypothetical protein